MIKRPTVYAITFVTLFLLNCTNDSGGDAGPEVPSGEYLGEVRPGLKPVVFSPDFVSSPDGRERDVTFTPDMQELYFTRNATIMVTRQVDGIWTEPDTASFSGDYQEFEAHVSPDGQRLYYISRRPLSGEGDPEAFQLWFVERTGDSWGEPKRLTDEGDYYPTITNDGEFYLTGIEQDLFRVELLGDSLGERVNLGDSINTERGEYNACIAPDGSYILFTSGGWGVGFGDADLYVSFRKEDGSWTTPKNMGPGINSSARDYCPSVTRDGRYMFFSSLRNDAYDLYWVDAEIIQRLRTEDLHLAERLYQEATQKDLTAVRGAYSSMQKEYAEYCDFNGDLLNGLSDRLLTDGNLEAAADALRLLFELHPSSESLTRKLKLALVSRDDELFNETAVNLKRSDSDLAATDEAALNILGYNLLWNAEADAALKVFALNTELFPTSANVYDSYGEGLLATGDTTGAIENYRHSLTLNPDNQNAVDVLQNLGVNTP